MDIYVSEKLKQLYNKKDLDEYKIGTHKKGGCETCYNGGFKAIKNYKGGVKVYKKESPAETVHIDIASHNLVGKGKYQEDYGNSSSDCETEHKMGGRAFVDRVNLPSSSMAGGSNKLNKRAEKVKEIMKKNNLSMIEASKYIKQNNIKY